VEFWKLTKRYALPEELARHISGDFFTPEDLRQACWDAGEGLGREDAAQARFRAAEEMVRMWYGLDLPAWEAPYSLRAVRLGYLRGYEEALFSGGLSGEQISRAARARWGEDWERKLADARERRS